MATTAQQVDTLVAIVEQLAKRIERLDRAAGEALYLTHGEPGYATLSRQAPHAAELLAEYLGATVPANDRFTGGPRIWKEQPSPLTATERSAPDGHLGIHR
jgi:hypothetical protein